MLTVIVFSVAQAMTLSYVTKGSNSLSEIKIPFDPPLLGYEEVKPRLLAMKVDAEEALGIVSFSPSRTLNRSPYSPQTPYE